MGEMVEKDNITSNKSCFVFNRKMKSSTKTFLWLVRDFSLLSILKVLNYYRKKQRKILSGEEFFVKFKFKKNKIKVKLRENSDDFAILRGVFMNECYKTDKKANIIFDCGAHIGLTSIYYSLINPQAKIYCFEPDKQNISLLKLNLALNKVDASVFEFAISNKNRELNFEQNKNNPSYSKIVEKGQIKVLAKKLDTLCNFLNIKKIDLLKLDIEGQEIEALECLGDRLGGEVICENHSDLYGGKLKKKMQKNFILKKENPIWFEVYGINDSMLVGMPKF